MSVETFPETAPSVEPSASVEQLEDMFNLPETDSQDKRELSPTGSRLDRLSNTIGRVADLFNDRALNRAHGKALEEDESRTQDAQSEAYDSYDTNIKFSKQRARYDRMDAFDVKLNNGVDSLEQKLDQASNFVKGIGRTALQGAIEAGVITLGLGQLAGEAVKNGAVSAIETSKDQAETGALKAMYGVDKLKDQVETGALKAMDGMDTMKDNLETSALGAMYAADRGREAVTNAVESIRTKISAKAEAAQLRRDARRTRWSAKRTAFGKRVGGRIDSTKEAGREAIGRDHAARAAGSAALAAIRSAGTVGKIAYNTHNQQNHL